MKTKQIMIGTIMAAAFCVAWGFGKATSASPARVLQVKDLSQSGDPKGSMEVARALLQELREHDWDWNAVSNRADLMRVPDQDYCQNPLLEVRFYTWVPARQNIYQDEVAFYSSLYTWNEMTVVPGHEARLSQTGFYIVAWKDGLVERVPVHDSRLYPTSGTLLNVFPGMSEYDPDLPGWESENINETLELFKQKQKLAKPVRK